MRRKEKGEVRLKEGRMETRGERRGDEGEIRRSRRRDKEKEWRIET